MDILSGLKDSCAAGPDEVKIRPLKVVSSVVSIPLTHICNLILMVGVFPDKIKLAHVVAIHKGGSVEDLNNCRPISILSVFSKIAEHIINKKLTGFLTENCILAKEQSGLRKTKSTESVLLESKE